MMQMYPVSDSNQSVFWGEEEQNINITKCVYDKENTYCKL